MRPVFLAFLYSPCNTVQTMVINKPKKEAVVLRTGAFAVIMTGGKQYKVQVGNIIKIEKIAGEHSVGDKVAFDKVLMLDNAGQTVVGAPFVSGSKVGAEIKEIGRDPKINVVHNKPKSKYFKKQGHRQPYFKVVITSIL